MKKQIISMAVMAVVFAACGGSKAPATVVGSWVMPINGQPGEVQGIKLEENGQASSINMHTLISVSYTHLDVYKRQIVDWSSFPVDFS